jgi:GntR family transcriptional repressor for pyruvate dehydrogenase complex
VTRARELSREASVPSVGLAPTGGALPFRSDREGRRRLFVHVVEAVEERILSGQLKAGELLPPERVLTEQFGVSRTVVREAMKALERSGLVEARQGLGVVVASPSESQVADSILRFVKVENSPLWALYELRTVLETECAALAAMRRDEDDLLRLKTLLTGMAEKIDTPLEYVELDLEFHRALISSAHNPIFQVVLEPFRAALRESRALGATVPQAPRRSLSSHRRIFEAIKDRDSERARKEVHGHFRKVASFLSEAEASRNSSRAGSPPETVAKTGGETA